LNNTLKGGKGMKRALTTGEIAKAAATSKKVIRNLIHSGKLKAYRLDRDYRIEPSEWEAFKENRTGKAITTAEEIGQRLFKQDMQKSD